MDRPDDTLRVIVGQLPAGELVRPATGQHVDRFRTLPPPCNALCVCRHARTVSARGRPEVSPTPEIHCPAWYFGLASCSVVYAKAVRPRQPERDWNPMTTLLTSLLITLAPLTRAWSIATTTCPRTRQRSTAGSTVTSGVARKPRFPMARRPLRATTASPGSTAPTRDRARPRDAVGLFVVWVAVGATGWILTAACYGSVTAPVSACSPSGR
jgi:hypothetical protein